MPLPTHKDASKSTLKTPYTRAQAQTRALGTDDFDALCEEEARLVQKSKKDGALLGDPDNMQEEEEEEKKEKEESKRGMTEFSDCFLTNIQLGDYHDHNEDEKYAEVQKGRKEFYQAAMTSIGRFLRDRANSTNAQPPGVTKAFWALIKKADVENLVEELVKVVPNSTTRAIGHAGFSKKDILDLPRLKDRDLKQLGNYVGLVERTAEECSTYIGSSCNTRDGIWHRLVDYNSALKNRKTRHMNFIREMLKTDAQHRHWRALFVASALKDPQILIFETWNMVYMDSVSVGSLDVSYMPSVEGVKQWYAAAINNLRTIMDPKPWSGMGLNRTWSISQTIRGYERLKQQRSCYNCNSENSPSWIIVADMPLGTFQCRRCYEHAYKGFRRQRTEEMEQRANAKAARSKPTDGCCEWCRCGVELDKWHRSQCKIALYICQWCMRQEKGTGSLPSKQAIQEHKVKHEKKMFVWSIPAKKNAEGKEICWNPVHGIHPPLLVPSTSRYFNYTFNQWVCRGCKKKSTYG